MKSTINPDTIFEIKTPDNFRKAALSVFSYQATQNLVYKQYINILNIDIDTVTGIDQIPFLPIAFFKTQKIITESVNPIEERNKGRNILNNEVLFSSSGTTGSTQSKHYVKNVSIYERSYQKAFQLFYGDIEDYCILALLPSYLERKGSSLIYMVNDLIKKSKHPQSGFYLNNHTDLISTLKQLETKKQKTILIGVSYALLDLAELMVNEPFKLKTTIVMETGGMKGKRQELVKEELHSILCTAFGVDVIHSEYGMTELLSQAYSKGNGVFNCPPWMKILIRDVNDPLSFLSTGKTGGINIIDLANINSCSFIATQDLGKVHMDNSFEVMGRFTDSDIRGCNLLVE